MSQSTCRYNLLGSEGTIAYPADEFEYCPGEQAPQELVPASGAAKPGEHELHSESVVPGRGASVPGEQPSQVEVPLESAN